jgi:glycosyltransferase involved in cell wall biosynthesis
VRTTLLTVGIPSPASGSGGSQTTAAIAATLGELGQDVTVCAIVLPEYVDPSAAGWREQLARATEAGLQVECVHSHAWNPERRIHMTTLRALTHPHDAALVPTLRDAEAVGETVASTDPDAVLVYNWDALAASTAVSAPRFGAMSDPLHLPVVYRVLERWRSERRPIETLRDALRLQARLRRQPRLLERLLGACEAKGAFGAQHAATLRRHGVDCAYYPTPIPDPGPGAASSLPHDGPPRILVAGHLRGTATRAGVRLLEEIVPLLEHQLGADGFELRIVGGYEPGPEFATLLAHASVRAVGFVPDFAEEIRTADVVLVPIPIRLGVRVRVLTSWAYGRCVVAHAANAAGIPELVDDVNAVLATDARGLADATVRALQDAAMRERLGAAGRTTFAEVFAAPIATRRLAETLEQIAAARPATRIEVAHG